MDERFVINHLILLVGGNPLPNAVAGKSLVALGGIITLVHSQETADVAQRLGNWLRSQEFRVQFKQVEESNPVSIVRGVLERLKGIKDQRVGLNYTGGTKAMSVHAYRAVEQWAKENGIAPVFSYLDARKLQMVFDPADVASGGHGHTEYVGRTVELKLKDLLELHGWKLKHNTNTQTVLPASAKALSAVCASDDSFKDWKEWVHGELRAKCRRPDKDDWKSKTTLGSLSLTLPGSSALSDIVQSLQSELVLTTCELALKQPTFNNNAEHLCEWLDGKWLEHHVLNVLKNLPASLGLHQCEQNIETHEVQFDVDVVALSGYQLFAFSCSTDSRKGLLKSKLFEAYIRARQLGGDEARVALVCCSNDPEGLEHEMRRDVDPEGRIRVFGRKHLAGLVKHLAEWIQNQNKGV